MTQSNILFIGMDVHKESIEIAVAEGGIGGEVRRFGAIGGTKDAFKKALRKLVSRGKTLHFCYEAGPTGYELYRYIKSEGHVCIVVAPSLIPKKSGDRVKTDKRDAIALARLYRACELTEVYVPSAEDEAVRDLVRARGEAMHVRTKAKQRLKAFLLRHDIRCPQSENWSEAHLRWLAEIQLPHPTSQIAYQEYLNSVTEAAKREERLMREIDKHVRRWRLWPAIQALMGLKGVAMITACTIIAELGDLSRFKHPKHLMSYLGLTPTESSTGSRIKRGSITKTGNSRVRRVLIEAAWNYRFNPKVNKDVQRRQEHLPQKIRNISWEAQLRLTHRYKSMLKKDKIKNIIVVSIARELSAFIWAIFKELDLGSDSIMKWESDDCALVDNATR